MSHDESFILKKRVLKYYIGHDKDVIIPDGVKEIGPGAFDGRRSLVIVNIDPDEKWIERVIYSNRSDLRSVVIPGSVKKVGAMAFFLCGALERITMYPGVEKIEECAFLGCESLAKVILPETITVVNPLAFRGCTKLSLVVIPSADTIINDDAFSGCEKLTIHAPPGSFAEGYAKKNQITFLSM